MALQVRAIKAKIKGVGNIRKITKAMEMVAASKMRKAVARALSSREYAERSLELMVSLAKDADLQLHLLLSRGKGNRTLLVVVQANRGLCGGFNAANSKAAAAFVRERAGEVDLVTVGRYAERFAKKAGLPVVGSFVDFPESVASDDIYGLTRLVLDEFRGGEYREVFVVYNNFVSSLSYKPLVRQVLPVSAETVGRQVEEAGEKADRRKFAAGDFSNYLFEPSRGRVLDVVLPRLVESVLFQAILESAASEHSARMLAMKNASDNAKSVIEDLTLSYNHARQEGITREIAEISAGASALGTI